MTGQVSEAAALRRDGSRRNYSEQRLALLVTRYAALAVAVQRGTGSRGGSVLEAEIADLEEGLARVPKRLYEVLTLRGLQRLTNLEAAHALGVHPNTASRRYMSGLRWLVNYLNKPQPLRPLRPLAWRGWAAADVERARKAQDDQRRPGPGRPPEIPRGVDEDTLKLYCAGSTERDIAEVLNRVHPREDTRHWTRASVRSVLRRYRVVKRPRGRKRAPGSYRPGDITQPGYRETEFGEPFCDPDELLKLR